MVARITSSGIARNASSNAPISTTGHSTRPATSASRPSSSTSSKPCAKARFLASVEDHLRAARRIEHDLGRFELRHVVVEPAHLDRRRRQEAVAVGGVAGRRCRRSSNGTTSGSSVSGPNVATIECSGRTQLSAPGLRRTPRPSASTSARETPSTTSGTISAITSIAGRPGFSITAT